MKKIIRINALKNEGNVTLDGNKLILDDDMATEVLNMLIPYTRLFKTIFVKNFTQFPEELLTRLTNQYLHGAEIVLEIPAHRQQTKKCIKGFVEPIKAWYNAPAFAKIYKLNKPRKFYSYKWVDLDLTAPVPRSLAEFTFERNGKSITYLQAISELTSTKYLPNDLWNALDEYSRAQIDKCREFNKGNYTFAEEWYKELMKDAIKHGFTFFSPCKKTYFEAMAEIEFENQFEVLPDGLRPLNNKELAFLYKYAPAYGVDIPQFQWRINTRKTDHGYTEEIERVYYGLSQSDYNRMMFDPKNPNSLPKFARQNLAVKSYDNDKLLRDAYTTLKWLMRNLKDSALMPEYKRCPHCHEIYHENVGCECGYCKPVEFIQADNLFYGNASTYEDIDATRDIYSDIINELGQDD